MPHWKGDGPTVRIKEKLRHLKEIEDYENSLSKEFKLKRKLRLWLSTNGTYYFSGCLLLFGLYNFYADIILISIILANINWNINKRGEL